MFTAPEFKLIRKNCLKDYKALLENLSIPMPDLNSGDETKLFEQLDKAIDKTICYEMKSLAPISGYIKLLKMGGVPHNVTDPESALISLIVANEKLILKKSEKNVPRIPPELEKSLITYETEVMIVPLVFGAIFLFMTLLYTAMAEIYFPAVTAIGLVAGLAALGFGLRGEERIKRVKPPEYFLTKVPPDALTPDDTRIVLDSLKLIDKINQTVNPPVEKPSGFEVSA